MGLENLAYGSNRFFLRWARRLDPDERLRIYPFARPLKPDKGCSVHHSNVCARDMHRIGPTRKTPSAWKSERYRPYGAL
jgi:hypothetical protein